MSPVSLWLSWRHTVAASPDAEAVVEARDGRTFSREELSSTASNIAGHAPGGWKAGQTVAFAQENGARWLTTFLALQKLAATALPLDASLSPALAAETASALGAHWLLDGEGNWLALTPPSPLPGGEFCLMKTTSGSTGEPRCLAFTSTNMLADGRNIAATMGIGPDDRNLGAIPFGHSYGLGNLVMPLIEQGTAVIASTEILPDALATQVERFGATVLPSVPAVLRGLAKSSVDPARLSSLRRVISAGAPLPADIAVGFRERFGCPIQNFYGSSETGGICFDRTGESTSIGRSIGVPLEGVEVTLNVEGRVTVRSEAVITPGEYTLADYGEWTEQGELTLTGRAVPLANIGGKKISPLEIEKVLRGLPGVTDTWVGVRARLSGEGDFLLAAVETERTLEDVRADLTARLPAWQVPRRLWIAPRLPRNERGKLDRRKLEDRLVDGTA